MRGIGGKRCINIFDLKLDFFDWLQLLNLIGRDLKFPLSAQLGWKITLNREAFHDTITNTVQFCKFDENHLK